MYFVHDMNIILFTFFYRQESWPLPHLEVDGKWSDSSRKEVRSQGFISIVLVLKLKKSTFPSPYSGNRQFNTPYLYTRPTSPGAAGDTDRSFPCHSSLSHSETWGKRGCFDLMVLFNSTQCSIIVCNDLFSQPFLELLKTIIIIGYKSFFRDI